MDFEKLLEYLKEDILTKYANNINKLVSEASAISLNRKKLEQWEKECKEILRKQSPESMEAEQVKAENRTLVKRLKELERSYEQLNREHCNLVNKIIVDEKRNAEKDSQIQELKSQLQVYQIMAKQGTNIKVDEAETMISQLATKNNALVTYTASLEETIKDLEAKLKNNVNLSIMDLSGSKE